MQVPVPTAAEQEFVPSETVTVPVKVPEPGLVIRADQPTAYDCPASVGAERSLVIESVVSALFTPWEVGVADESLEA